MISLSTGELSEIAVLGAHCDDIAIGMGGTLLTLCAAKPGLRVRAHILSGGWTDRQSEELGALKAFCPGAELLVSVLDIPDGHAPAHWDRVKKSLNEFRKSCNPQVVFAPHRRDAHQDHRLVAKLVPTEFRDHLILGYEILKWETDTPQPTVFQPLTPDIAEKKAQLLLKHYPSQSGHDWFDEQSFLGLSRLRGVQCRAPHAEAFTMEKAILVLGGT